jgi:hypothetical protein
VIAHKSARPRFQAGGTVRQGALYVERPADVELPEALWRGDLAYVLATRQIGKSSLRLRVSNLLEAEGLACVSIDLTLLGTTDTKPEDWYFGLASEIAEQLHLESPEAFWDAHRGLGPVHCWSRYVEDELLMKVRTRIVIFIDEIDATLSLPFSRDDFFAAVRAIYLRRAERPANERLTFCLLGVAAPGDLIADPTRTPFNVGTSIRLEDFTREEVSAIRAGFEGIRADPDALVEAIFGWTSGHPYMTQRLCRDLVDSPKERTVDEVVRARFLDRGRAEDPSLQHAERHFDFSRSREDGARSAKMLRLYGRLLKDEEVEADGGDPIQLALRLTGMAAEVSEDGGKRRLRVRNRVFREVLDAAWLRAREADRAICGPLEKWLESGRKDDAALRGEALAKMLRWAEEREDLTAEEQAFLRASTRAEDRREVQLRTTRLLAVMIGIVLVALGVALWQFLRAEMKAAGPICSLFVAS